MGCPWWLSGQNMNAGRMAEWDGFTPLTAQDEQMFAMKDRTKVVPEGERNVADVPPMMRGRASQPNPLWHSLALRPSGVQAKLVVSQPADPAEQEADQVADHVMRSATSRPGHRISVGASPSNECSDCEE